MEPNPEELLQESLLSLAQGEPLPAIAWALQGLLQLGITQHLQALGMMDAEGNRVGDDSNLPPKSFREGTDNPLGECAAGHEQLTWGCDACEHDAAEITADSVEIEDRDDRR